MKLNEFKAWFDGFTEGLEGPPSKKQWERIKEQVAAIDGTPISYPVYVDRYLRYPTWPSSGWMLSAAGSDNRDLLGYRGAIGGMSSSTTCGSAPLKDRFDSVTAMYAAGKAEALAA